MKNQILYFLTNKSFLENLIHYFFIKDLKCLTFENLLFSARKKNKISLFQNWFRVWKSVNRSWEIFKSCFLSNLFKN